MRKLKGWLSVKRNDDGTHEHRSTANALEHIGMCQARERNSEDE